MRLTVRWRAALAAIVMVPLGYWYLAWSLQLGGNIIHAYRGRTFSECTGTFRDIGYRCNTGDFDTGYGWFALVVAGLLMLGIVYLLGRWVVSPLRPMSIVVGELGPTNLVRRLPITGPRDETRELAEAINAMLERVAEGYESQRRFAADASHELRTPLAVQRTLIEVSLQGEPTADQLDLLSRQLLATNERNADLIEALLALAESDRGLASRTPQSLDVIVDYAVGLVTATADTAGLRLSRSVAPSPVIGERALLERLVLNLLQNAIKYNEPGGWVAVTVSSAGDLTVSNSGPLVPADAVATLFEPFRRLNGDRLSYAGGAGLGLTIARSIVSAHGGTITAQARAEGGLDVTVTLPVD